MKEIPLTRGLFAIVDDDIFDVASQYKWYANQIRTGEFYAARTSKSEGLVYLHKFIMGKDGIVDHINGNRLDCRRSNMRITDYRGNSFNRKMRSDNGSGFIGVKPSGRKKNPWRASIQVDGKEYSIGPFSTAEEAAIARDAAAIALHGEFARLNFPCGG